MVGARSSWWEGWALLWQWTMSLLHIQYSWVNCDKLICKNNKMILRLKFKEQDFWLQALIMFALRWNSPSEPTDMKYSKTFQFRQLFKSSSWLWLNVAFIFSFPLYYLIFFHLSSMVGCYSFMLVLYRGAAVCVHTPNLHRHVSSPNHPEFFFTVLTTLEVF